MALTPIPGPVCVHRWEEAGGDKEHQLVKAASASHSIGVNLATFASNSRAQTLSSPLDLIWEYVKCGTGVVVKGTCGPARTESRVNSH